MKDLVTFTEEILNGKLLIFLKNFYAMMCMKTKIVIQNVPQQNILILCNSQYQHMSENES